MERPVTILHVDDDPAFAETVVDQLERANEGFAVDTAGSASEALEKLDASVDCVVSDYELPGRDGIELLDALRGEYPDLPFILYTGTGSEAVASEAISAGVTDYLEKESGTSQYSILANRIENAVEQRRTNQRRRRSERRFTAVFEDPQILVGILDPDGRLQRANQTAMEYVDASHETVTGELFWETPWWDDEIESDVAEWVERAAAGEYVSYETTLTDPAGSRYHVSGTIRPVTADDGEITSLVVSAEDITARREHEQELETRSAALEASVDGIAILDAEERYSFVNQAHADIYGYDSPETFLGESWHLCYTGDEHARLEAEVLPALQEHGSWRGEAVGLRADGTTFPQELSLTAIDGGGIVCVVRDITARKEREEERRLYEQTLDTLPDSASIFDTNFECIYVNQTLVESTGIPREEYLGEPMDSFLEPLTETEADAWTEAMQRLVAGERTTHSQLLSYPTDDGSRHLETTAGRIESEDGDLLGVVNVLRDVTERVEVREQLERQNDLFRKAQDMADVGAWEYDVRTGETIWTERLYDIFGIPDAEEPPENTIEYVHPEDRSRLWEHFQAAERRGEPYDIEIRIQADDGTTKWVQTHGEPQSEGNEIVRIRGSYQNITDRKERERELERRKNRYEEFAGVVSHDLRNPLNVAAGHLDLARSECESSHLETVAAAHERMEALIDDLLTLAQIGTLIEETEPVELATLARTSWQHAGSDAATLDVDSDLTIQADASRLQELLENLFRNAVEHGGGDVTVTVGVLPEREGFYVADDGGGIPADERERVFEAGHTTADDGTGFGLKIVREIASGHGWDVSATDSESGGARFEFTGVEVVTH